MIHCVNIHEEMIPSGPIRIWDAGVQWADIEKQEGVWDWTKLDNLIDQAGNRSIMLVLGHPPEWAAKGGSDGRQASWMPAGSNRPPKNMMLWRRYVKEVVKRYKGRVKLYQVWNEPADKRFYSGKFSELGEMSKIAYGIIKANDPKAKVVSTPLQPRKQAGWDRLRGRRIRRTLEINDYPFDIWSCHIYPQTGEGLDGFTRDLLKVVNHIKKSPKRTLWITETNYNLLGEGNPYSSSRQDSLKRQTEAVCNMLDIGRVYWYSYKVNEPWKFGLTEF